MPRADARGGPRPTAPTATLADRAGLFVARALAWALLLAGWLALGSLGAEHATALPGGAALPLVVWLLAIGLALAARLGEGWAAPRLAAAMAGAAAAALGLLAAWPVVVHAAGGAAMALAGLAALWAVLTVGASRAVYGWRQRVRQGATGEPGGQAAALPSPALAAVAGGAVAWAVAGDLLAVRHALGSVGALLAVAGLGAFALAAAERRRPRAAGAARPGCRAGLFDCSLPLPSRAAWRQTDGWPLHAAALAMLPMMVALPAMAQWCSAAGWSPRATAALHLAAMLLPGALAQPLLARCAAPRLAWAVTALLVAGVAALVAVPGLGGLMALSLLHAVAWSLAWGWQLAVRGTRPAAGRPAAFGAAVATATAVAALGALLAAGGPAALTAPHAALAALAIAGFAAARVAAARHRPRVT